MSASNLWPRSGIFGKTRMTLIFLLGLILIVGLLTGRLFNKFGVPQVVGFILLGLLLGDSFSHLAPQSLLDSLSPITSIGLAIIGFMVGGEMKHSLFTKYGKQFFVILFAEGLLAMAFVTVLCLFWTRNPALSIILGALSAATAPAATVDVLWEYHSRGPLTSAILAIVALDDGLSLILYGFALAYAEALVSPARLGLGLMMLKPLIELCASIVLGLIIGWLLDRALRLFEKKEDKLVITLGGILLASGVAVQFHLSLILVNMVAGVYLSNTHQDRNEASFELIKSFSPPILIIFFVFIGARLQVGLLPKMGILGLLYVVGRTLGKGMGSYLGARVSHAHESVRKYLGFALFSQAGVAIGLALDVYEHFRHFGPQGAHMGHTVINVITATTFLVQIIGPPSVKYAIGKAGEIGKEMSAPREE